VNRGSFQRFGYGDEHVWNPMIASEVLLAIMAVLVTPPHHVNVIPR
jgi:hypothetical protein